MNVHKNFFQLVNEAAAAAKAEREEGGLPPLPENQSYRGVRRHYGKWGAEIRDPLDSERAWLGTYASAVDAAYAYDIVARVVQGNKARPNFFIAPPMPEDEDANAEIVLAYFADLRHSRLARAEKRLHRLRLRHLKQPQLSPMQTTPTSMRPVMSEMVKW